MTAEPAESSPPRHDPITTEQQAADLVRLVLDMDDIMSGSLLLFVCDADARPTVPVLITDVPVAAPAGLALDHWFEHLQGMVPDALPSLVFARARPGRSFIVDHDRGWHDAVVHGCARTGIRLLGAFVVSQHAVVPSPPPVTIDSC